MAERNKSILKLTGIISNACTYVILLLAAMPIDKSYYVYILITLQKQNIGPYK